MTYMLLLSSYVHIMSAFARHYIQLKFIIEGMENGKEIVKIVQLIL